MTNAYQIKLDTVNDLETQLASKQDNLTAGAGGGGYYGGGAGAWYEYFGWNCGGGGGGSSYTNQTLCSNVVHTQGFRAGNGYVTISMV